MELVFIKLLDLVLKEYFAVIEHLKDKIPIEDGKIIISSKSFYRLLDTNLYIKRKEKLDIYKTLNLIICNSNGLTSVVYDKETKKASRKIVINFVAYEVLKKLHDTEFK